jgi:aspartate racemase
MIGIIGGVGPYAGLDLVQKIFNNTIARDEKEHLPVSLISTPEKIEDRTKFLIGESDINPGYKIAENILLLEKCGAEIVGIACNSAHAPSIFNVILEKLSEANSKVEVANIIKVTVDFVKSHTAQGANIGIMSTIGTHNSGIYSEPLKTAGFNVIDPDREVIGDLIHKAIYDTEYGIKSMAHPVSSVAKEMLKKAIDFYQEKKAKAIILGCTELPIAIREKRINGIQILDPTTILARHLIQKVKPEKLRPL